MGPQLPFLSRSYLVPHYLRSRCHLYDDFDCLPGVRLSKRHRGMLGCNLFVRPISWYTIEVSVGYARILNNHCLGKHFH